MACTCIKEYKEAKDSNGNVCIIGLPYERCQECLDTKINVEKQNKIQEINQQLAELDRNFGIRAVREDLLARGIVGFKNEIANAEAAAIVLRAEKALLN